ncbi:putative disulfide isomerase [Aspergillus ruber CBS 135680]|uniref:Thioredoxin-domain-containing protein n=1 Tax=Aspergillus ruber (strain CBS 135680) TaxID=1388766 RepID=A0A017SKR7_ASPRC|nr:thioredoxin-domain-containing protein [Aspergillus ruber CBS 135680]EYE97522.1 thioredoxin-domain-containing protein [Aspergillus ruber CBS 135680]
MKPSTLVWSLLSLVSIPSTFAATPEGSEHRLVKRAGSEKDAKSSSTTFNGVEVPPMRELTPDTFQDLTKEGYWFVKHFSPSCPHCTKIAPTWQTLYEFYYASNPLSSSSSKSPDTQSLNSFQKFYDFHFASMNCLAYADLCSELDVGYFPLFALYHNGKLMEKYEGPKDMKGMSEFVEEKLELIRPGSRPVEGVKLPEPGEKKVNPKAEPEVPAAKDKNPEGGAKAGEKHNEKAAQLASSGKKKPKPKSAPANPQGISVPLTAESFQKLVTTSQDPWFIKFYAPWCGHCQALAPAWGQMGREMQHVLNIGEVNCDAEPRLCKDAHVNAFPTMYFFRGGERVEYNGLRGLGDLVNYAKRAVDIGSGVQDVDAVAFQELEEKEEVIFLYFYDHATTSEDFEALERLTLSLIGHARIVKTNSAALAERFKISTWPRLLVVRDGRPNYYNALAPKDMRDFRQVLNWMSSVWLPIVPELTASNAREVMAGKYVVLGILSRRRSDDFILGKRELKNAAHEWMDKQTQLFQLERKELRDTKQLRIEEADDREDQRALRAAKNMRITIREDDKKQVGFAWVDGDFWERWLRTTYGIDVENGERVIINDEDNRRYWDTSSSGATIMASRTSILETIPLVIANPPKLTPKSTVGTVESAFFSTRSFISNHPIIFIILLTISVAAVMFAARGRGSRRGSRGGIIGAGGSSGGGFFQLEGKEGLLNGGTTGKVD